MIKNSDKKNHVRFLLMMSVFLIANLLFSIKAQSKEEVAKLPLRIISLKPNITEILFALGVGKKVVGVTTWCDYPKEALEVTKVANYLRPSVEAVLGLKPDLVVVSEENGDRQTIDQIRLTGIKILLLNFNSVPLTLESIKKLGAVVGAEKKADEITTAIVASASKFATIGEYKPTIAMLVGAKPLVVAGPSSFVGELITLAGGENAFKMKQPAYPQIDMEKFTAAKPDIIIFAGMGDEPDDIFDDKKQIIYQKMDIRSLRAGPRIPAALESLNQEIEKIKSEKLPKK